MWVFLAVGAIVMLVLVLVVRDPETLPPLPPPPPPPVKAAESRTGLGRCAVLFTGKSLHSNVDILNDIYANVVLANNADAYFVMDLNVPEDEVVIRKIFGDRARLIRYTQDDQEYAALENDFASRRRAMIPQLIKTYGQENFQNTAGYMELDFSKSNSQFSRLAYGCKLLQSSGAEYDYGIRWRIDVRPLTPFVFAENAIYFTRRDSASVHDFYWAAPWPAFSLVSTEFGKQFLSFFPQPWFRDMACPEVQLCAFLHSNGIDYENVPARFKLVEKPARYWTAERST